MIWFLSVILTRQSCAYNIREVNSVSDFSKKSQSSNFDFFDDFKVKVLLCRSVSCACNIRKNDSVSDTRGLRPFRSPLLLARRAKFRKFPDEERTPLSFTVCPPLLNDRRGFFSEFARSRARPIRIKLVGQIRVPGVDAFPPRLK